MTFEDDEEDSYTGFASGEEVDDDNVGVVSASYSEEYDLLDVRTATKEANLQALIARRRVEELLIDREIKQQVDYLLEEEFE